MNNECPVCLDLLDMSTNIIITLECCKKEVHINCIKNWLLDVHNKTKDECLLCRKKSDLLKDLRDNFTLEPLINNDIENQYYVQIIEQNGQETQIQNNNFRLCKKYVSTILSILIIILIIIFNFY